MPAPRLPPAPNSQNLLAWASQLTAYIAANIGDTKVNDPSPVLLPHQLPTRKHSAVTAGLVMFDPVLGVPVFSKDKAWHPMMEGLLPTDEQGILANDGAGNLSWMEFEEFHAPSGAASWRIIGTTLECWGTSAGDTAGTTVPFPKSFTGTPAVNATATGGAARIATVSAAGASSFTVIVSTDTGGASGQGFRWHAIGEWDGVS